MQSPEPVVIGEHSYLGLLAVIYVPSAWVRPAEGGVERLMNVYVSMARRRRFRCREGPSARWRSLRRSPHPEEPPKAASRRMNCESLCFETRSFGALSA